MSHLFAVIMAGGAGTRFWPESRAARPKQLLRIAGPKTMLEATVERLGDLVPLDHIVVATTQQLAPRIAEHLPQLPRDAVLAEPCKRNTAPCIGLAALRVLRDDPEAVMAVMPADHMIETAEQFQGAIRFAASLVEENGERLVTFGIQPTYPAETFGYIERGRALAAGSQAPPVYRVVKFHEKPDAPTARQYLKAGNFYWNSGIFVWKAETIIKLIERFEPEMYGHLRRIAEAAGSPRFEEILRQEFSAIEPVSIDYAVMEKADDVVVVEAPFSWSDVGSWRALERLHQPDAASNVVDAARHLAMKTSGTIVRCADPNHLVVTLGVSDLIVVVTSDVTVVATKDAEEQIRDVVERVKREGWTEYL